MKSPPPCLLLFTALVLSLTACEKKPDLKSTVSDLEKVFTTAAAQSSAPAQPSQPVRAPQKDAEALVKAALSAARENDYAKSVIALQAIQDRPGLTVDQVTATQRAKQAIMGDLQERAAKGDQAALAQLKAIEKTRSQ